MTTSGATGALSESKRRLIELYLRGRVDPLRTVDRSASSRPPGTTAPLSFEQELIWIHSRLAPHLPLYNEIVTVRRTGPLDVRALERSLAEIVRRHEAWRTTFDQVGGEVVQVLQAPPQFSLPLCDLSTLPEGEREREAFRLATEVAQRPLDLVRGPLVRTMLVRMEEGVHRLYVVMHHLVHDGIAVHSVFLPELVALYEAFVAGKTSSLPELGIQYADYCREQRREPPERGASLDYWRRQLAGAPRALELPTDHTRPTVQSFRGRQETFALTKSLTEGLKRLSRREQATLFVTLLAALKVLLHRYTGQEDIVVGTAMSTRKGLELETLLGLFLNPIVLRTRVAESSRFREVLSNVHRVVVEALSHGDVPFHLLVRDLLPERDPSRNPLFQASFILEPPVPTPRPGWDMTQWDAETGVAKVDLAWGMWERPEGLVGQVRYNSDLWEPATIVRFIEHFQLLLEGIVTNPEMTVSARPILTPNDRLAVEADRGSIEFRERREQTSRRASTGAANGSFELPPPHAPPHRLFEERAGATPDALAASDARGTLSYRALDRRASALARHLRRLGAGPGRRVALLLERSLDLVVALLAVLKTGAAYVPIDPRYPSARVRFVLDDAAPHAIVTERGLLDGIPTGSIEIAFIDGTSAASAAAWSKPGNGFPEAMHTDPYADGSNWDPKLPAYLIYTSGSTGRPKGVVVSVGALANFLRSMMHTPGIGPDDRLLSLTTIAFDISGLELLLPIVSGASVHVAPNDVITDGRRLVQLIGRTAPTFVQATPAMWRLLVEAGWKGDGKIKVLCGGEALPRDLAEQLLARAGSVWNMYGPTETTIWSTVHRVESGVGSVPIGRPIDRTRVYLLDENRELVPRGTPGEIWIGGDGVAEGYFHRADLTAERFVEDPLAQEQGARMYRTGDSGRLRADGTLEYLGRLDQQIKLRGFRIEPGEIEAALRESGSVKDAAVLAREDRPGDARLVAYYVPSSADTRASALREMLRGKLPAYMVPASLVALEALPRTPNGKLDRAALPAPDEREAHDRVAPRDPVERSLARLWEEMLGVPSPSVNDDFFLLGGHSLLAVRLLAAIEREHNVEVPVAALLEHPTIEALAARIRSAANPTERLGRRFEHLVAIREGHGGPPLVCVHGAGGHVLNMGAIARHVGGSGPFYGVQARGVDGRGPPFARIEDMAIAYVRELRVLQPHGPYYLSGYCGGGIVAVEMAKTLRNLGEPVALVALVNTYRPRSVRPTPRLVSWIEDCPKGLRHLFRRVRKGISRVVRDTTRRMAIEYHRMRGGPIPSALRDFWLTEAFFRAAGDYRPLPYDGKLTVLRAVDVDPGVAHPSRELGWAEFATGGIDLREIPGDHDSMSQEPNVVHLGAALRDCLDRARIETAATRDTLW